MSLLRCLLEILRCLRNILINAFTVEKTLSNLHLSLRISSRVCSSLEILRVDGLIRQYFFESIKEICVPKSVRIIHDKCFSPYQNLFRNTFVPGSRLEKIGFMAFGSDDGDGCVVRLQV